MVPAHSHKVPRVSWYSGSRLVIRPFAYGAFTLSGRLSQNRSARICSHSCGPEPRGARAAVWALPVPLAATPGIDVSFSSSGYLDVSVRRVPFHTLWIGVWIHGMLHVGFPIQTSPARWVFAPPRSFSQLITSFIGSQCLRHPPYALCILTLAAVKISLNSISSLIFFCLQHLA